MLQIKGVQTSKKNCFPKAPGFVEKKLNYRKKKTEFLYLI